MAGLDHTRAQIPGDGLRLEFGTAYWDGAEWFIRTPADTLLRARWLDPIQPQQGGPMVYMLTKDDYGLSSALVLGGYWSGPRPGTGTVTGVTPAGPGTIITFDGSDGVGYSTDRFVGSYNVGDVVLLDWSPGKASIIGPVPTLTIVPPPAMPVAPPAVMPGTTTLDATASDTYWAPGGWGSWARGGERVYTGAQSGQAVTGAWFYGAPRPELAGKTINRVRFYLPQRLGNVGDYNSAVDVHIYAHTSGSRPGGDVARVEGPHVVNIPAGFGGAYIDLHPGLFGPHLVNGGGISISGGPYAGFISRLENPEAGKVIIDWMA